MIHSLFLASADKGNYGILDITNFEDTVTANTAAQLNNLSSNINKILYNDANIMIADEGSLFDVVLFHNR